MPPGSRPMRPRQCDQLFGSSAWLPAAVVFMVAVGSTMSPAQSPADLRACTITPGSPRCEAITLGRAVAVLTAADVAPDSTRSRFAVRFAHDLFRAACAGGFGDACYFAAEFADDSALALKADLMLNGCHAPRASATACAGAGDVYRMGVGRSQNPDSALALYRLGCAMERTGGRVDPTVCYLAGLQTQSLPVLPSSERQSLSDALMSAACREGSGSPRGCMSLVAGLRQYWEQHEERRIHSARYARDATRIWAIFRTVCERGVMESCARLGQLFETGSYGREPRPDSALHFYERACYRGRSDDTTEAGVPRDFGSSALGCQMFGNLLLSSGTASDSVSAVEHYRRGCIQVSELSAGSCVLHAVHTYKRKPVGSIFRTAIECESGWPDACFEAGRLASRSAESDTARSTEYLELARRYIERGCTTDHGDSCNSLGEFYERLRWTDPSGAATPSVAWSDSTTQLRMKYYRRACGLRNAAGCRNLANALRTSFGGRGEPFEYLRQACELGHPDGCWEALLEYRRRGDALNEGRMRALACRRNQSYCKKKAGT